jgi:hypothetical protein
MRSMSGMKPMSSMRSASSTTIICTPVSISLPRSKWSSRPARGGDQHVDALVDQLVLILEADAADQQRHGELVVLAVGLEVLGDLRGELAGGAEHQAARHARAGAALGQDRDHRQRSRRSCRCRSGRCRGCRGPRGRGGSPGLDRGGGHVAGFGHGLHDLGIKVEIGKAPAAGEYGAQWAGALRVADCAYRSPVGHITQKRRRVNLPDRFALRRHAGVTETRERAGAFPPFARGVPHEDRPVPHRPPDAARRRGRAGDGARNPCGPCRPSRLLLHAAALRCA